jgi:sugar phosphate isomerase/epimerase
MVRISEPVLHMRFGISTHLYHDQRLSREHLAEIASFGFEAVEVFATRSHFDYHDPAAIADLRTWLDDTGLVLHGLHAPIVDRYPAAATTFSIAASDASVRQAGVREAERALAVARTIPFDTLVVHLGTTGKGDSNSRSAASRGLEEICSLAEPLGVRLAVEVIPNDLSSASVLVTMLERDFEDARIGICLDFGHAHLMGDVADAIETAAEHLITTHVHDNRGREDDHLVPYRGTIDWPAALVTMQKIGYDGTYLMELASTGTPASVLEEARRARQRFERALAE